MEDPLNAKKPNPIDIVVGERVRLQRMGMGMSQGALGAKLGVTFQQVQKYERGTNRIGASRLQKMAEVLGVPIGFFFEAAPVSGDLPAGRDPLTTEGVRLNSAFLRIKDLGVRRRIIELVRIIADGSAETQM